MNYKEEKWRYLFCGSILLVMIFAYIVIGIIASIMGYLFTGLLIYLIAAGCANWKIVPLWFPALWNEKVYDITIN